MGWGDPHSDESSASPRARHCWLPANLKLEVEQVGYNAALHPPSRQELTSYLVFVFFILLIIITICKNKLCYAAKMNIPSLVFLLIPLDVQTPPGSVRLLVIIQVNIPD